MGSFDKSSNNFFLVVILSFIFISVFSLNTELVGINRRNVRKDIVKNTLGASVESKISESEFDTPQYYGTENLLLSAKSILAIDIESGAILFEKNPLDPVMPASTSKIITALVSLDTYNMDQLLYIPQFSVEGQKIGLKAGETLPFEDLLYALLVASANDAAEVLAENYPGGRDLFIAEMNIKAQSLGLSNSFFVNPTGLDAYNQTTTAHDMVKASFYAMQNKEFAKVVGTKKYNIISNDGNIKYQFSNINQLLGKIEGVKGIKTGKTDGAMENLITYVERDGKKILMAVLGSENRFEDTTILIDWIFKSYSWK